MNEAPAQVSDNSEKFWLASYPSSVPPEIPALAYRSLGELFESCCVEYLPRVAFRAWAAR